SVRGRSQQQRLPHAPPRFWSSRPQYLPHEVTWRLSSASTAFVKRKTRPERVAHASCTLASASSQSRTSLRRSHLGRRYVNKDCFGATPKPARGTRAIPRIV